MYVHVVCVCVCVCVCTRVCVCVCPRVHVSMCVYIDHHHHMHVSLEEAAACSSPTEALSHFIQALKVCMDLYCNLAVSSLPVKEGEWSLSCSVALW